MTIVIEQPDHLGDEVEVEAKTTTTAPINEGELVLDGGFVMPQTNSFGHMFRAYHDAESERQEGVENFYRKNHTYQSVDFVKKMREEYSKVNKVEMSIWECCELLNEVVDESDPDLDEPQIEHLLQTAEAIRRDYPDEDWLHLTGLIHDLGKVLNLPSFGGLPQWAVVGDTFPVGCRFDESIVHHKYFKENPDYNNPAYNTKYGIYSERCGLNNVMMSWGHDDYMYLVAKENNTTLPSAALFIIRYHSFYALHREGAYKYLMNEKSDIYSFGVVILELVTGKRPVDPEFGEKDLVKWVCTTLDQKGVDHLIDSRLDTCFKEEICKIFNIGLMCTSPLPINRPSMRRVVKMLQEVGTESQTKPAKKDGKLSPYYYDDASDHGSVV